VFNTTERHVKIIDLCFETSPLESVGLAVSVTLVFFFIFLNALPHPSLRTRDIAISVPPCQFNCTVPKRPRQWPRAQDGFTKYVIDELFRSFVSHTSLAGWKAHETEEGLQQLCRLPFKLILQSRQTIKISHSLGAVYSDLQIIRRQVRTGEHRTVGTDKPQCTL